MNALFEAIWRASAFGLAALCVALGAQWLLSGRAPAAWRAWIWRVALLQSVFALLPLAPVQWKILAPPNAATPRVIIAPITKPNEFSVDENLNSPLEIPDAPLIESAPPIPIIAQSAPAPLDWRALALAIYGLGLAFQFAQLARGKRQLQRITRNCAPAENAIITARLQTLATRMQLKTAPQLLMSSGGSPFLTGVWRPRIVLPRAWCEAEIAQLDAILAHELAHCKRRDLLWLGATWLGQTLLWFHPLSWVSRRFHGLETECACDELALQLAPIAPQSYGALLLNSMNNSKFSSPLAAGTCDTLFALKTRLLRLNNAPKTPHKTAKFAFALALLISCGAVVPLKLVARAGDAPVEITRDEPKPKVAARAVVQGVVISGKTKKPVAGVPIILFAPSINKTPIVRFDRPVEPSYQEIKTDARGYFRFNTIGSGQHSLGIDGRVEGARFWAYRIYDFKLKNGMKRDFKVELDQFGPMMLRIEAERAAGDAVVQGVVTSKQTGKPLAGVPMILSGNPAKHFSADQIYLYDDNYSRYIRNVKGTLPNSRYSQEITTDARGYFRFNAIKGIYTLIADGKRLVSATKQLDFTAQEALILSVENGQKRDFNFALDKAPSNVATPPGNKGAASASGQIVDENRRPLAGATVHLTLFSADGSAIGRSAKSDAEGRFRFDRLRLDPHPRISVISVGASMKGYGAASTRVIKSGPDAVYEISLPRASAILRGVVIGEDGRPARNFQVRPYGSVPSVKTNAQGRFLLPQIVPGKTDIRILTTNGGNGWGPIAVRGGDQNLKIRLTRSISDARFPRPVPIPATSVNSSDKTRALIGKTAPEIQALRWANGKAATLASLRGKVVLLAFQDFTSGDKKALSDFARSFAATARVVGVQINTGGMVSSQPRIDAVSTRLGFPVAIDAPLGDSNGIGGFTLRTYGFGIYSYAVIGRDGKIIYAGDELTRAIQFASR